MTRSAALLLILALTGTAPAPADSAAAALKARRWADAARLASVALATTPNDAEARLARGFARARLKDYAGSLADFTAVLGAQPGQALAWHGAGKTLRLMGDLPGGLAANDRALALAPDEPDYLVERGVNLFNAQAFGASSAAFERVYAVAPGYAGIHAYRAEIFLYLRDADEAEAAAGRKREPGYGIHRINLAHAALFAGDLAKAKERYLACADLIDMDGVTPGRALVPQDFAKMRAAGIEIAGMAEVEKLLAK